MITCSHFPDCGGCKLIDTPYSEQLVVKQTLFKDALPEQYGDIIQSIIPSRRFQFHRNKMEFAVFYDGDDRVRLGLKRAGRFDQCVATPGCQLLDQRWAEVSAWIEGQLAQIKAVPYHQKRHDGVFRYVMVRRSELESSWLINFVVAEDVSLQLAPIASDLMGHFSWIVGVVMSVQPTMSDTAYTQDVRVLTGRGDFIESIGTKRYRVSPYSFFQTNSEQAQTLYQLAVDLAEPKTSDRMLDLYCGAATIGIYFSEFVGSVLGVEENPSSIADGEFNISLNNATNMSIRQGKVKNILKFERPNAELIVVDPPRSGLEPKALRRSAAVGADRIVYVSCKPSTLGRDLLMYREEGYDVVTICPVDMFPHSPHLEAVALLQKS